MILLGAGATRAQAEPSSNGALYLQHRLPVAERLLAEDKAEAALAEIDRILSMLGSLENPQAARVAVASALADSLRLLLELGQVERAHGIYRASGVFISQTLSPRGVDAAAFRLTEMRLLDAVGDAKGEVRAATAAAASLGDVGADNPAQARLRADALTRLALACTLTGDTACARKAEREHPFAALYETPARPPASIEEVRYLVARAVTGGVGAEQDVVATAALAGPLGFAPEPRDAATVDAYRAAGRMLALAPGPARDAARVELGRGLQRQAQGASGATAGAWYRPGLTEQRLIALALDGAKTDASMAFTLLQIAGRSGPSFDADALTALAQAHDPLQRRTIHEALRLRARRDRQERQAIAAIVAKAGEQSAEAGNLRHDAGQRLTFRDFALRIGAADAHLARDGIALSGANTVDLRRLQAVLAPDEAAVIVMPTPGGLTHLCVRRDATFQASAVVDPGRLKVDTRLLQVALSATYAPSEALDTQFPVEAAMRLYDGLIRPSEPCLRPGDRIVWLPGVASVGVPLAALLPAAPPRLAQGYDLSAAHWLVRDHAVSYAGSAAALVAARSGGASSAAFDFLGVGDPTLGAGFGDLAPLPDTRVELEASARGFREPHVLLAADATEARFRGELTGAYRYLSFATHGLLRDELPGLPEPALVLTPGAGGDPANDGLLTANEIADLNLAARFVALSACNTANFDISQMAQDLPALASAFAVAGAPSVLGTLWPVNSLTGRTVVADTFAGLRSNPGQGAAAALAVAQRAFLTGPPSRAYLHPRFWAPFVILGDGGGPPAVAPRTDVPQVTAVEVLTRSGGEALDVRRGVAGVIARFVGDADTAGRHGAALSVTGRTPWRHDTPDVGATRFVAELGRTVLAGGYGRDASGRFVPVLEAFDAATGVPAAAWRGDDPSLGDAVVLGGAKVAPDRALVIVGEALRVTRPTRRVRVLEVGPDLAPRLLFETALPAGFGLDHATLTPVGGDLLLTVTAASTPLERATSPADDYDVPLCSGAPTTWIEVRNARTGALMSSRTLAGVRIHAALARGGEVLLGGAAKAACDPDAHAIVLAVGVNGGPRPIYDDTSLGQSMVWSLGPLSRGRVLVAATKQTVVDYAPVRSVADAVDAGRLQQGLRGVGGMVLVLRPDGRASTPRMLEAGGPIFVNGADASRPDDILLSGALSGQAAIFHLSLGEPGAR